MDETRGMRRGQASAGLEQSAQHSLPGWFLAGEPLAQRPSLDQFHDDEDLVLVHADVVDGDHRRMRQTRHGARLALDAGARFAHCRRIRPQQLECDAAAEFRIAPQIDDTHGARADRPEDLVATHPLGRGRLRWAST